MSSGQAHDDTANFLEVRFFWFNCWCPKGLNVIGLEVLGKELGYDRHCRQPLCVAETNRGHMRNWKYKIESDVGVNECQS